MVNKIKRIIVLSAAAFFITGCANKDLEPESYLRYFEVHKTELMSSKDFEPLVFEASYIPTDMMAARDMDLRPDKTFDKTGFSSVYKNYETAWYFSFKIKPLNNNTSIKNIISTKENYSRIKQYLAAAIKEDFKIERDSQKISCSIINVESDISVQNSFLFIMSFEKQAGENLLAKDLTLVYDDNLFQNGILKFNFSKDQINSFPKIKVI